MKSRTIKKSKETIEKEGEALMQLEDAVKLYYENRFFSSSTLAMEALKTLEEITKMKVYAGRRVNAHGMSITYDPKRVWPKGRLLSREKSNLTKYYTLASHAIWSSIVFYCQINDRYPRGKPFEKFLKDKNLGLWQIPFHSVREEVEFYKTKSVLNRPINKKKAGKLPKFMQLN